MTPGRNEPCPCGSGKKFKKCCGAVIPVHAVLPATASQPDLKPAAPAIVRTCGTCTSCCEGWAAGTIRGHDMRPGLHCHFLIDRKCTIYVERPVSPCRNFVCSWLAEASPFPDEFRPDKIGVIIIRIRWRGAPAHLLLSAGHDPDATLIAWMETFAVRTGQPFFYSLQGEKIGFGPVAFQQEMMARLARGEAMW